MGSANREQMGGGGGNGSFGSGAYWISKSKQSDMNLNYLEFLIITNRNEYAKLQILFDQYSRFFKNE